MIAAREEYLTILAGAEAELAAAKTYGFARAAFHVCKARRAQDRWRRYGSGWTTPHAAREFGDVVLLADGYTGPWAEKLGFFELQIGSVREHHSDRTEFPQDGPHKWKDGLPREEYSSLNRKLKLVQGRPTYKKRGKNEFLYYSIDGFWTVGPGHASSTGGWWRVSSKAMTPGAIVPNASSTWRNRPQLGPAPTWQVASPVQWAPVMMAPGDFKIISTRVGIEEGLAAFDVAQKESQRFWDENPRFPNCNPVDFGWVEAAAEKLRRSMPVESAWLQLEKIVEAEKELEAARAAADVLALENAAFIDRQRPSWDQEAAEWLAERARLRRNQISQGSWKSVMEVPFPWYDWF